MEYSFRNLILGGGGVRGIAYVGAIQELEKRRIMKNIKRVGGTSWSAIIALLLTLGYTLKDTQKILLELSFNNFIDDSWGIIRDSNRLISEFGWYKGDFFESWIGQLIRKKTGNENSTFNDLRNQGFLDLYLIGSNLSTGFSQVFSTEHTSGMRVRDAVRISMSIPLFLAPIRDARGDMFVDGGVFYSYPIKLFDREKYIDVVDRAKHTRKTEYYEWVNDFKPKYSSSYVYNAETLGLRLYSGQEIKVFRDGTEPPRSKIDDFFDYLGALLKVMLGGHENQHLHTDDWHRTVYINTIGVGTTDFDLDDATKRNLVKEGRKGIRAYFDWFDNPESKPINRL